MTQRRQDRQRQGLSRTEVLVILGVVVVAGALLVPVRAAIREKNRRVRCAGRLKQIGLSLLMYSGDNDAFFPQIAPNRGNNFDYVTSEGTWDIAKVWACPSASIQKTARDNSNYLYIGSGLRDDNKNAATVPLAFDASGNHPGNRWMNALFIDAHAEGARPDGSKGWNRN